MTSVNDIIAKSGVVAILRLDDLSMAVPLTEALIAGGISAIEITLTNPRAPEAIAAIQAQVAAIAEGRACIGAGSIITPEQARQVIDAGAQYLVTPNTDRSVIETSIARGIPIVPGAFTPSEIQAAHAMGASAVKVFPARSLGPSYIRDVLAPLPHLKLVPTGGISLDNIAAYLKAGAFAVGIGSNLFELSALKRQDWAAITAQSRLYADAVLDVRHAMGAD